jgi:Spy/CpxP family protein refolding chaperone
MLLRGRNELALTDDQIKRLEALAAAQSTSLVPPASAMMRARADLMDATKGDGDLAAARRAMERLAQIRTDAMLARLKARQEARAILSAEQKAKLVSLEQEMRGAIRRGARGGQGRRGWRGGRGAAPDEMRGPGRGGMPGEGRGRPMPRGPGNPSDD